MKRFLLLFLLASPLAADDMYFSSGTVSESTAPFTDPFADEAARRLNAKPEEVLDLRRRGFGKTEILSFIAISRASKTSWDELVKERERGTPMRRMAGEAGLDYNAVFDRSTALKKEIDSSLEKTPKPPQN
jgi:hypothetical protein